MIKKRGYKDTMADDMSDYDSDDDINDKDGFNSHCGLRTISEKVLQVLLEKRTTTYKQVSDFITNSEAQRLNLLDTTPTDQNATRSAQTGTKDPAADKKTR